MLRKSIYALVDMEDWKPEKEIVVPDSEDTYLSHRLYLWTVPAAK